MLKYIKKIVFVKFLGEVEFDLSSIYFSKDHVLKHKWMGLSNMEKKFNEIKGFLKLSINVVGPED